MKQTIYISGAISGVDIEIAKKQFAAAEQMLKADGFEVVNPMELNHKNAKNWADYMRTDIIALCGCSAIYMLKGWRSSRGATLEHIIAIELDIKIIYNYV